MSYNQSRSGSSDKSESQYRKSGRSVSSNQQRTSSGAAYGKGGGGPGPPPSSPSASSSLSSNRSFKKSSNPTQGGGQFVRAHIPVVTSSDYGNNAPSANRNVQNGTPTQPPLHGASDAPPPASSVAKAAAASSTQRSTRAVPKAPTSQPAALNSESAAPLTPAKAPGDACKPFAFQFGTISPGFMNGMQVPARTSSAPPNLDEQKRDQARHDAFKPAPSLPTPAPKQQLPRKEVTSADQTSTVEAHPVPKAKKETQAPPAPSVSQSQKPSVLPIPMTSMQMQYQQPVSVQFGGPSPQIQSQGVPATSLQMPMPMPIPMGNAPQVQQPVFIQGLQPHQMQPQGMMHQGQSLGFTTSIGPQINPQLGGLGIGINSQYSPQHGGTYGGPRKTPVKITDPKTREELRLDKRPDVYPDTGSSGLRSHLPPPQPIPSFGSSHPMNYYGSSYNTTNLFFQASSSLPLTGNQIAPNSQPPRFNYPVSQAPQNVPFSNASSLNPLPVSKPGTAIHGVAEPQNSDHARYAIASTPSGAVQVTVKPAPGAIGEKIVDPSLSKISAVEKGGSYKSSRTSGEAFSSHPQRDSETHSESSAQQTKPGGELLATNSLSVEAKQPVALAVEGAASASPAQSEEAIPVASTAEGRKKESLSRTSSIKEHQKKQGKKGNVLPHHQIGGQSTSLTSSSSRIVEDGLSSSGRVSETAETKTTLSPVSSEGLTESAKEPASTVAALNRNVSEAKVDSAGDGVATASFEVSGAGVFGTSCVPHDKLDDNSLQEQQRCEYPATGEQGMKAQHESIGQDNAILPASVDSKSLDLVEQDKEASDSMALSGGNEVPVLGNAQAELEEPVTCHAENDRISDTVDASTARDLETAEDRKPLDTSLSNRDGTCNKEISVTKSDTSSQDSLPVLELSEAATKHEGEAAENSSSGTVSVAVSGSKEKPGELARSKSSTGRLKKKRKEILLKADLAGTTSDLYGAYKGPEEKIENVISPEGTESSSPNLKWEPADAVQVDSVASEKSIQGKAEPDDWEDAADMSTPKLESLDDGELSQGGFEHHDEDGNANTDKKYSRDFLLKFSEQCTGLPDGFELKSEIPEVLMNVSVSHHVDRDSHPGPARVMDRTGSGSRIDRRGSGMVDDRWGKQPGPFGQGRDMHVDIGFAGNLGFRPVSGSNFGVLRNPRGQSPVQYVGGILSGPMQSMGTQGGMQRGGADADRWQRAANFVHKGLIPSPHTPLQMMHKAEKKYEVGKVTDEEQAKQRQLKGILNKLTPQNFEKLFEQVNAVNIDNVVTLNGVISQIFDKALMEPTFCEMYANFCYHLAGVLPELSTEDNEKVTFKRLLLNKCQEEFERGKREEEEANKADEEGEIKQSDEEREAKRLKARRQMLGNIRLIGELYKKRMLTERIMHECIKKLLGQYQNPDEENVESLCKLMSTIGEMIDHPKAKEHMDAYFEMMEKLSNNKKLSSRVRFMLKDAIDLRKNKWQQRRKVEGPKKIEEVHRDAAQERQLQTSRLARNPGMNPSPRRAPMDFAPRGSTMMPSPNAQMGGFRGMPSQVRGYGAQDVRFDPLPQRTLGEDITLGPQGGLARGMSFRGSPAISSTPIDYAPGPGDSRRMAGGLNGFSSFSERSTYSSAREEPVSRYPERFGAPGGYDQLNAHERNMNYINRDPRNVDRGFDRPIGASSPTRAQGPPSGQSIPMGKVWPEERLRDMSIAAIKEFYSARDEKEVALCIKELNSPNFHPSMISLWVTHSFERKDMERDLLAKLLINLTRSHEGILDPNQLVKGFESVLSTLEDAVNDAPRAPEFLGRILGRVVLENVVPLIEIGRLLREGGEEPGSLLEFGLAGDVLGNVLEVIKVEKGEGVLSEIRSTSSLRLEDFQPPVPNRSRVLEKFI